MAKVLKEWLKFGCSFHVMVYSPSVPHFHKENLRYVGWFQ